MINDPNEMEEPATWTWAKDMYNTRGWTKERFIDQAWRLGMSNFDIIKTIKERKRND